MKANELQINNFFKLLINVQFVISVYQWNTDWTDSECKELLNEGATKLMNEVANKFGHLSNECKDLLVPVPVIEVPLGIR